MKKLAIFLAIIIILGGVFFWNEIESYYHVIVQDLPILKNKIVQQAEEIKEEINAPPPLRSKVDYENAILTRSGVINWTNEQRKLNNLPPLKENFRLNNSAKAKVQDMFARQYFEHVAPTGESVGDLVKNAEYDYIVVGENLALGNFKNDQDLVQAWMDSPGHRANILNTRCQDIGVSVLRGSFEGKTVWLAVQHFGLSAAVCPKPNDTLKSTINELDQQLDQLQIDLERLKKEVEQARSKGREYYNQKVNEYNAAVNRYNDLLAQIKNLTVQYNSQVDAYNKCLTT